MSTSDKICKDGTSESSNDVCEVTGKLHNMNTADLSVCANCGKEGDDVNNICNKCKQVKYCNAACKKKHRHKHKKDCNEYVRLAAKLHDIELFKQPPQADDCPICFLRIPSLGSGSRYMTCCGKRICCGCFYAPVYDDQGNEVDNEKCPFCRTPPPTSEEDVLNGEKKRVELGDARAIYNLGCDYQDGTNGYRIDYKKALECWYRAAELGCFKAYDTIGHAYKYGQGVEIDMKKATYYYELAALKGDETARCDLGIMEGRVGNYDRALKHFMIAVSSGNTDSLDIIKEMYSYGHSTKDEYTKALQSYQEYLSEIKSPQRDEAAAADEEYRYY